MAALTAEEIKDLVFVRVFSKKEYATQFRGGALRMGSLAVYQKIEDGGKRGDPDEGAILRGVNGGYVVSYGPVPTPSGELERIVIKDALSVRFHDHALSNRVHILCLYALNWRRGQRFGVIRLPPDMHPLGAHAVFVKPMDLLGSIASYCSRNKIEWSHRMVEYLPEDYSGDWGIFKKTAAYAGQDEYRVAIRRDSGEDKQRYLVSDVGPIPGAHVVPTHATFRVQNPCPACRGILQGVAAPMRKRRRRIQKKINSRLGASRFFQVCMRCHARVDVRPRGELLMLRERGRKHRTITTWKRTLRSRQRAVIS